MNPYFLPFFLICLNFILLNIFQNMWSLKANMIQFKCFHFYFLIKDKFNKFEKKMNQPFFHQTAS